MWTIKNPSLKSFISTIITSTNTDTNYLHNCNAEVVNFEPEPGLTMKPGPSYKYPRKDFMLVVCWSLPWKTFVKGTCYVHAFCGSEEKCCNIAEPPSCKSKGLRCRRPRTGTPNWLNFNSSSGKDEHPKEEKNRSTDTSQSHNRNYQLHSDTLCIIVFLFWKCAKIIRVLHQHCKTSTYWWMSVKKSDVSHIVIFLSLMQTINRCVNKQMWAISFYHQGLLWPSSWS